MRNLAAAGARDVCVLDDDGTERRIPASRPRAGQRFVVRPGERIAADGEVLSGQSAVDRSMMTGESVPVDAAAGDAVTGGTIALTGRLVIRADKVGADTQLAHLITMVEQAQAGKAGIQRLADRVCAVFVPAVLAVLIIACPCALGLAAPAALVVASGRGAQLGIFIKGYRALESSRAIDTVVLDKTGTVTTGQMTVTGVLAVPGVSRGDLLRFADSVEQASEHAVAAAVTALAAAEAAPLAAADGFRALPGQGARGTVDGHEVTVGRATLLAAVPPAVAAFTTSPQPGLGLLLQRPGHPAFRAWLPQPPGRRGHDDPVLGLRRLEQPAPAPLHRSPAVTRRDARVANAIFIAPLTLRFLSATPLGAH